MDHHDGFLPFIVTHSYAKFVLDCDYVIQERLLGLVTGDNGAGKSWAVVQYIRSSARLLDNGRYPYLYINLSESEKTDRAIYNMIVRTIRRDDKRYASSSDAKAAVFDLWYRFGFRALFVDDVLEIYKSGIEALRTFHDRGPNLPHIPVIVTTIPSIQETLGSEPRYKAFYTRIGQFRPFEKLDRNDVGNLLLNLPTTELLRFDKDQADANDIIEALYTGCGGGKVARASFRDLNHILKKCNILLRIELEKNRKLHSETLQIQEPRFDAQLVRTAIQDIQGIL